MKQCCHSCEQFTARKPLLHASICKFSFESATGIMVFLSNNSIEDVGRAIQPLVLQLNCRRLSLSAYLSSLGVSKWRAHFPRVVNSGHSSDSGKWSLLLTGKGDPILQAVGEFTLEKEWVCPVPSLQPVPSIRACFSILPHGSLIQKRPKELNNHDFLCPFATGLVILFCIFLLEDL